MTDSSSDEFDPTAPDQREIGREMVDDSTGLGSVMAHAYRGEIDRMGTWRQRLDETTKWAVTLMAAILTWAFSSTDNPHYLLLVGIVVVTIFLGIKHGGTGTTMSFALVLESSKRTCWQTPSIRPKALKVTTGERN